MTGGSRKSESTFAGRIGATAADSRPDRPSILCPPQGAPNAVVVLLDDVGFGTAATFGGPSLIEGRARFTFYRDNVRMPELSIVNLKNTSFDLTAELAVPEGGAEGVVVCQGGNMAGWSLYVRDSRPVYFRNWVGHEMYAVESPEPLPAGQATLKLVFGSPGPSGRSRASCAARRMRRRSRRSSGGRWKPL